VVQAGYRAKTEIYKPNVCRTKKEHNDTTKMLSPTIKKITTEGLRNYVKLLSFPDSFMNIHLNLCVN
jgi:hypothetical protein